MTKKISLQTLVERVAADVPDFAAALEDEETHLVFCRKLRSDLKQLRDSMGYTQKELAEKLQMSQSAVTKFEKGEGDIGVVTLCRYANALGMQPSVSFTPASASYLEPMKLKATVKAMERLAHVRTVKAEESIAIRHALINKAIAGQVALGGAGAHTGAAFAAVASTMNGALMQSLSTEMVSMLSALSGLQDSNNETNSEKTVGTSS
jgi:transcriptional regulator with XRE-family HTH domain